MKDLQYRNSNYPKAIIWVTLGSLSYGLLSTFVKSAYAEGYEVGGLVGTQAILGAIFLVSLLMILKFGQPLPKPPLKQAFILFSLGIPSSLTGFFYYSSMQYISASLAIVLLFQFTWIGMFVDMIKSRRLPSIQEVISLVSILIGTVLGSGLLQQSSIDFPWEGVLWGLLSAVSYALFIFSNGAVAKKVHPIYKSLFMVIGSAVMMSVLFPPVYFLDGTFSGGLWKWSLPLALFGMVIPPLAYAKGMPHLSLSLGSILGSIELPMSVFMASLVLQERVSSLQWIGVLLILLALTLPYTFRRGRSLSS